MSNIQDNIDLETSDFGTKVAGIAGFILLFVFGGSWLYNTELTGAIIVPGKVDIMGEAKIVQHRDGGVVSKLMIVPGQVVEKGQLLIELDVTEQRIRANATAEKMRHLSARLYRLHAESKDSEPSKTLKAKPTKIGFSAIENDLSRERALMEMRKQNRRTKFLQGKFKLEQLQKRVTGLEAQIISKRDEQSLLQDELKARRKLYEQGFSTLAVLRETQKDISESLGEMSSLLAEKAALEQSIEETKMAIQNEQIAFKESVLSEIISVEAEIRELNKNLMTDKTIIERAAIRAPTAGTIHKVEVFTIGGVITPSQELMQIVPANSALEIEASLETRHVDDVTPNQTATVRFSGFDARTTPELNAFVRSISPDIVTDPTTGAPYYQVKVRVPPEEIKKLNVDKLVPGMPVEIFINTGERTAFQYLTDPLVDQLRRAFRE